MAALITLVFFNMFPDSEIAKSFQLGCFVILYDESLNPMTQTCKMDLLACYFDETEEKVKIRYLDL